MSDSKIVIKAPPPKPNLQDPAYQKFVGREAEKGAIITAKIAIVARLVPGIPGKIIGALLIGVDKDVGEGKLSPTKQMITNFGPSPFGFSDPRAFDLEENFWLTRGTSNFLPQFLDLWIPGLDVQRNEDERDNERERITRFRQAALIVSKENQQVLDDLINNTGSPFSRASAIRAFGPLKDLPALRISAANEKLYREYPELRVAINTAGFVPTEVLPTNLQAIINAAAAEGIRKELITERADP